VKLTLKIVAVVSVGLVAGIVLCTLILYLWPFSFEGRTEAAVETLAKAEGNKESFFLNIVGDIVLATHGGNFPFKPIPDTISLLGDGQIPNTFVMVTKFRDAFDGDVIAFGTELEIAHAESRMINGKLMTHTLWSIVVPGRGTLHLYQTENNWQLFKRVILPMLLSGKPFEGEFKGINTLGPLNDYQGLIIGGTGEFSGLSGHFIEYGVLHGANPDGSLNGLMELRINYVPPR